jgi:hypothetical protein
MKRIALTIAMVAFAANAFAAAVSTTFSSSPMAGITFIPSKNVTLGYSADAAGATGAGATNVVYSIGSKNQAGDRIFVTTSASSAIAQAVSAAGVVLATTDLPTKPSSSSDSAIAGGLGNWSNL